MLRVEAQHLFETLAPLVQRLVRNAAHQIDVDVVKMRRPRELVAVKKVVVAVNSPEQFQFFIVRGLEPQTQAVDAGLAVVFKLGRVEGSRIALDRNFGICLDHKVLIDRRDNVLNLQAAQNRGRPAADKNAGELVLGKYLPLGAYLFDQLVDIGALRLRRGFAGEKVAVAAFRGAERNVDVQFQFLFLTHRRVSRRS